MATLKHAFNAKDMNSLVYKILQGKMPAMPKQYSAELVSLIKSMLNHNPDRRPSVNRILREPYIKQHIAEFLDNTKKHQLNNYVAICYPLKAKVLSSMSFTYKTLAVIWITPLALAVWRGFNVAWSESDLACQPFIFPPNEESRAFFVSRAIVAFFIPLVILAVCYTRVGFILHQSLSNLRKMKSGGSESRGDADEKQVAERIKVIRLLVAILCVFFFSWGPNIVWETLYGLINTPQYAGDFVDAFYLLSYAHSALNPITYGFFSDSIRASYKRVLCCYVCGRTIPPTTKEVFFIESGQQKAQKVGSATSNSNMSQTTSVISEAV